jgi:hypothetical protein
MHNNIMAQAFVILHTSAKVDSTLGEGPPITLFQHSLPYTLVINIFLTLHPA